MVIPRAPIFVLIFSLLYATVRGIDASVSMFVFFIITYKPICFVFDFVVSRMMSRIISNFNIKDTYKPKHLSTKEFIHEIDESGDHHE